MRLLLFSDLHCDAEAARRLVERSESVDVLVGAGDFATCRRNIHTAIDVLRGAACPAVLVPGNAESHQELADACRGWPAAHVLHGTAATIDGVTFFGLGGAVPTTPFGPWSWDFSEKQAEQTLAACPERCVLVTHSPPKGAVDRSKRGSSLGSTAIRAAIEAKRPRLAVCGHIHDSAGRQEFIGDVPVVNAGPSGVEWELD
jgi:Icc-related predicted phosphoesterase